MAQGGQHRPDGGNGSTPRRSDHGAQPRGRSQEERAEGYRDQQLREHAREAAARAAVREGEALEQRAEAATAAPAPSARDPQADLLEAAQAVFGAGRDAVAATGAAVGAFGTLLRADLALARASLLSGTAIGLAAAVAAITTWLLLVWLLVLGLEQAGLPKWGAVGVAAAAVLVLTAGLALFALNRLRGTRMAATRRQWAVLRQGGRPT
jgi:hypothetical protein